MHETEKNIVVYRGETEKNIVVYRGETGYM